MPGKRVLPLAEATIEGGGSIEVWADAGCNDLFGVNPNASEKDGVLREARLVLFSKEISALYYDYEVLLDWLKVLEPESGRARQLLAALQQAAALLSSAGRFDDTHGGHLSEDAAAQARAVLAPVLARRGGDPFLKISAVGHAHMDLAWLWPIRETRRKGARTFATALANIELYDDYIFGASQPQLFEWCKEDHPALYAKAGPGSC